MPGTKPSDEELLNWFLFDAPLPGTGSKKDEELGALPSEDWTSIKGKSDEEIFQWFMSEPEKPQAELEAEKEAAYEPPGYFEEMGRQVAATAASFPTNVANTLEMFVQGLPSVSRPEGSDLVGEQGLAAQDARMQMAADQAEAAVRSKAQGIQNQATAFMGMPGNISPLEGGQLAVTPGLQNDLPLPIQAGQGALTEAIEHVLVGRPEEQWNPRIMQERLRAGMDQRPFQEKLFGKDEQDFTSWEGIKKAGRDLDFSDAFQAISSGVMQMAPQLAVTMVAPEVAIPFIFSQEAGSDYETALEKTGDPQLARTLAMTSGVAKTLLEKAGLDEILGNRALTGPIKNKLARWIAVGAFQGTEEDLQTAVDVVVAQMNWAKGQAIDPWQFVETFIPSFLIGMAGAPAGSKAKLAEQERAKRRGELEGAIQPEAVPGLTTQVDVDESQMGPVEPEPTEPLEPPTDEQLDMRQEMGFEPEAPAAEPVAEAEPVEEEAVPEEPPVYQGEERRADTEPRKPYEAMTPEEMRAELEKRDAREAAGIGTDALTGLPNRGSWNERLYRHDVTALFDLNHMKKVNDSLGHRVGDQALRAVANAARAVGLNLFRYGGEEFAADHDSVKTLRERAQALNDKLRTIEIEHVAEDGTVTKYAGLSLAFGIGEGDTNAQRESTADKALYADKARLLETGERTEAAGGLPPGLRIVSREAPGGTTGEGTATGGEREVRVSEGLLEQEPAQEVGPKKPFKATATYTMAEVEAIDPGLSSKWRADTTEVEGRDLYQKLVAEHGSAIAADNLLFDAGYDAIVAPHWEKGRPESVRTITKKEVPSAPVKQDVRPTATVGQEKAQGPASGEVLAHAPDRGEGSKDRPAEAPAAPARGRKAPPTGKPTAASSAPAPAQAPGRAEAPVVLAEPDVASLRTELFMARREANEAKGTEAKAAAQTKVEAAQAALAKADAEKGYVTLEETRVLLKEANAKARRLGLDEIYPDDMTDAEIREEFSLPPDAVRLPRVEVQRVIELATTIVPTGAEIGPQETKAVLETYEAGKPGLTVEEVVKDVFPGEWSRAIVYRDPEGKPIAAATIYSDDGGETWTTGHFFADKSQGLLTGRAVTEVGRRIVEFGADTPSSSMTQDSARLLERVMKKKADISKQPTLTPKQLEAKYMNVPSKELERRQFEAEGKAMSAKSEADKATFQFLANEMVVELARRAREEPATDVDDDYDESLPMGMGQAGAAPAEGGAAPEVPQPAGRGETASPAGGPGVSPAGQGPPGSIGPPTVRSAGGMMPDGGMTDIADNAETTEGKLIEKKLNADPKGLRAGMRTIADWLLRSSGVKFTPGLAQLAKDPASFTKPADIIRSAENTMAAFAHEWGHSILERLMDPASVDNPAMPREVAKRLILIAQLPGSRASVVNHREGFAEWARRRIMGEMPAAYNDVIENWVEAQEDSFRRSHNLRTRRTMDMKFREKAPRWMDVIRDAASLYARHKARSLSARVTSTQVIKHEKEAWQDRAARSIDAFFTGMVSGHMSSQLTNKLFNAIKEYIPEDQRARAEEIVRNLTGGGKAIIGMNPVEKAHQARLHLMSFTGLAMHSRNTEGQDIAGIYAYLPNGKLKRYTKFSWRMIKDQVTENVKGAKEKEEEWAAFLRYVQNRAEEARGGKAQFTGSEEADYHQLMTLVQEAENANPGWKKAGNMVQEWFHAWNAAEVDNGTMSKETAMEYKQAWEFYAPLLREDIPEAVARGAAEGRVMPIQELDKQAINKAISVTGKIFGQNFIQSFLDFQDAVEKSGLPWMVRKAITGQLVKLFPHLEGATKAATITGGEIAKIMAHNKNIEMYKEATGKPLLMEDLLRMTPEQYETDTNGIKMATPQDITVWSGAFDVWRRTNNYPSGMDVLVRYKAGKPTYYQVTDPTMFYSIAGNTAPPSGKSQFFQILFREPTTAMKVSITNTIKFAIRNVQVDFSGASMNSIVKSFWSWFGPGYFHWSGLLDYVLRKTGKRKGTSSASVASQTLFSAASDAMANESYDTYLESLKKALKRGVWKGGFVAGEVSGNQLATWVARTPGILVSIIGKPAEMAWAILRIPHISQVMEQAPRHAAAKETLRIGGTDLDALVAADFATGNFVERSPSQEQADWTRAAPFLNPNIQSMYQFWRKILHPDDKVAWHYRRRMGWIAGRITLLWVASQLMRPDDDEEEIALIERERDDKEKLTHMLVGGWLRMPFSRGIEGIFQSVVWNGLQKATIDMPMPDKREFIKELISRSVGDPMMAFPPIATAWLEYKTGFDFYLDRSYEQPWLKYKKRPQDQFYASTPKMYRMVSNALGKAWETGIPFVPNASPIQVEHFLRTGLSASAYDLIRLGDKLYSGELTLDSLEKIRQAGPISSLSYHFPRGFRSPSVRLLDDVDEAMGQLRTKLKQEKVPIPIEEYLAIEKILDTAEDLEATAELVTDLGKQAREQYELKNFEAGERLQKNMTYLASSVIVKYPELANQVLEAANWQAAGKR